MGHLKNEDFQKILASSSPRPKTYIETGCNAGDQLAVAEKHFTKCYGIEIDPSYAERTKRRLPNCEILTGPTEKHLPALLAKLAEEPLFILLDAHYCACKPPINKTRFPLWDELIVIRSRDQKDVIVIDDTHVFGQQVKRVEFEGRPDWEGVTAASLSSFFGVRGQMIGGGYLLRLG